MHYECGLNHNNVMNKYKYINTMLTSIIERRNVGYAPLIESFKKEVAALNINVIMGSRFPDVGECYVESK